MPRPLYVLCALLLALAIMEGVGGYPAALAQTLTAVAQDAPPQASGGRTLDPPRAGGPYPAPRLTLATDTPLVASPILAALILEHPAWTTALFPDTSMSLGPFELRRRIVHPTVTRDSLSVDCCTYELITFSPAPSLRLSMPIYYLMAGGDSLEAHSNEVTIRQRRLAREGEMLAADTLIALTTPAPMDIPPDYTWWGMMMVAAGVLVISLYGLLARPLERAYRRLLLRQRHRSFVRQFDRLLGQLELTPQQDLAERALLSWKVYIERLEQTPYSTFTTRDIDARLSEPSLLHSLEAIDRWIYGGLRPAGITAVYNVLRRMAHRLYLAQQERTRNDG